MNGKSIAIAVGGFSVGFVCAWVLKTHLADKKTNDIQEETEEIVVNTRKKNPHPELRNKKSLDEVIKEMNDNTKTEDTITADDVNDIFSSNENEDEEVCTPATPDIYEIDERTYEDTEPDYDKESLLIFFNGEVLDEGDNSLVDNPEDYIGEENLSVPAGRNLNEAPIIYVRNDLLECDYVVTFISETYENFIGAPDTDYIV